MEIFKKIILMTLVFLCLMMSFFYLSCQKQETFRLQNNEETSEKINNIPDFDDILFSAKDCARYTDTQILKKILKKDDYTQVPYTLNKQGRLTSLHLNGLLMNQIFEDIPKELICFTELKELALNHQNITSLNTDIFGRLSSLETLDLSDNPIVGISVDYLLKLKHLKFLYFNDIKLTNQDQVKIQNSLKNVQVFF